MITPDWNPDTAGEEMAALFAQADAIFQQPHYQEDVSADTLARSSADTLPTDQQSNDLGD